MTKTNLNLSVKRMFFLETVGYYLVPVMMVAIDYIAVIASVYLARDLRNFIILDLLGLSTQMIELGSLYIWVIFPIVFISFIGYGGMYTKRLQFWRNTEIFFKMCLYINALLIVMTYSFGDSGNISRLFMFLFWGISFFNLCLFRWLSKRILIKLNLWQRPVVIVGAGKTAELVVKNFENEPAIGYRIVGLIEDEHKQRPLLREYPYLGNFDMLEAAIIGSKVNDVIIATPGLESEKLVSLIQRVQPLVRNLSIVPDLFGIPMANIEVESFIEDRMIMLRTKNNLELPLNKLVKRIFDIVVGLGVFICIMPLLFVIAVLIKRDSEGPILHVANRIGKDEQVFACYKFRTMHVDNEAVLRKYLAKHPEAQAEWDEFAKLRGYDPRVTKIGRWLRRCSLDELPQIFNVLSGSMSLVGPRPYLPRERSDMGYYIYTITQTVPGITGLWQTSGRSNISFEGRLKLDAWYVRNWSLWQDIILLLKTFKVVFKREGAC